MGTQGPAIRVYVSTFNDYLSLMEAIKCVYSLCNTPKAPFKCEGCVVTQFHHYASFPHTDWEQMDILRVTEFTRCPL